MPRIVRQTLDCLHLLRIRYELPAPLDQSLLGHFADTDVRVMDFSRFVAGARDQFVSAACGRWRATGILGDTELVVVYPTEDGRDTDPNVADFEARLDAWAAALTAAAG